MSEQLFSDTALVYIERKQRARSIATTIHLNWFEAAPEETYHVRTENGLILELDRHLPVRPKSLTIARLTTNQDIAAKEVECYGGEELARVMRSYPRRSFAVFLALSPDTRYNIARLQATSANTPPLLRKVCEVMLGEHERVELA
jgi:hypothetical protein